jgi:hypothetical protein
MAQELRHPFSGAIYGVDASTGLVRVEHGGKVGLYTFQGRWQSGDEFDVDPEMCNWVGGARVDAKYDKPFKSV